MKLQITRKQTEETDRKGRSEGVRFEVSCQLHLDAHEQELVERYRQGRFSITFLMTDDIRAVSSWQPEVVRHRRTNPVRCRAVESVVPL